jgi:hypothetical protein
MYSQDSRSNSQHHVDASSEEAPVWPFYSTYYHQQEACPAYSDSSEAATTVCSRQPSSFSWEMGVERPQLPRLTEQQPSEVVTTFGSLEDHINQVCAYEQSGTSIMTKQHQEQEPSRHFYDRPLGARPNAVLTGPSMRSFLKVLCVYLERADPQILRDVKHTITGCCIQKQLKFPQFASLAEALERELKSIVGERYWKRIQMYHREICKNLQKRRV